MQEIVFRAMGCQMHAVLDSDDRRATAALARVPTWFAEWEAILSRFHSESELCALNRAAGHPLRVSDVLWDVLQHALAAARASDGLVTPTVLDALEAAGYDRTFEALVQTSQQPSASVSEWQAIQCEMATHTVRLPRGVHLDFGGVAKGWAADQTTRRLAAFGPALVDAGGDVAVSGARTHGGAWTIGVANPLLPDSDLALLQLHRGAVATSGTDYRRWTRNGTMQHHVIDPRTSLPAKTDALSATAVAPNAVQAEVAAKVLLILDSASGMEWVEKRNEMAGLAVLNDGRVVKSKQMERLLELKK